MIQKHGKTDVVSFRAPRKIADMITNQRLNVLDLVENGIISYCNSPGPKSEMIINGLLEMVELQIIDLQERKDKLLKLKESITPAQKTPVKAPVKEKCDILAHGLKTNTLYWITEGIADNCKDLFSRADWEEDTGDEYMKINSVGDIPECEI